MQAQTSDEGSPAAQAQRDEQINQLQKRLEEMQGELDALKKANVINRAEQHYSTSKASAPHPIPVTTQAPAELTDPKSPHSEPFAFADFTWLNGNARTKDTPYATQFFTPEIRADVNYTYDFRHPQDDTI
jgi:TolA-binding protein